MDALLEIFDKYRCHLKRGNLPMSDFLNENFSQYIKDVKEACVEEKNPLLGAETCKSVEAIIDEVQTNSTLIVEIVRLYANGKIIEAGQKAFKLFDSMKPQLMFQYSGAFRKEIYYRIRGYDKKPSFPLERKELFHIPYTKNHLIGIQRYSMPGHPCLYLASQAELSWYECGQPKTFAISAFDIPQDENNNLKLIDFAEKLMPLMHSFVSWFHNKKDIDLVRRYFIKYIYTYPLRAACSVQVEHPSGKYKEEYVIPQLLLQWVVNDDDFDGIRYESCSSSEAVRTYGGHNLVLVTKDLDEDGYDKKLRACVKVTTPITYNIAKEKIKSHINAIVRHHKYFADSYLLGINSCPQDFDTI